MLHLKHSAPGHKPKWKRRHSRRCNLCSETFIATAPHSCFCERCKLNSDLYRFHDWLPDTPIDFVEPENLIPIKKVDGSHAA